MLYDVGCSTGTTIAAVLSALDQSSQVRLVGIEPSPAMKKKALAKLAPLEGSDRVTLLSDNIEDFESLPDASVIVFLFTMQFVRPINRQRVLDLCWHSLKAGGCLILAEKVLADDSMLSRTYIEFYHAFKKRSGYSKNEISRKREALENVLIPYRDGENKKMLLDAGFRVVDRFFRWYNFAAYLAVKS